MNERVKTYGLVALGALGVNVALIVLNAFLFTERKAPQDMTDPTAVSLVTLEAPDIPEPEQIKEPEKPKQEEEVDLAPDLFRPDLSGPPGIDLGGVAVNIGSLGGGGGGKEFVFEAYELDQPPQPIVRVQPEYPFKAREQGTQGAVQVKMLVSERGAVQQVQIVAARPEGIFEDAVLKAVRQWKFNPGKIEGEAVTAWVVTTIRFQI
jgi:protein TonB